MLPHEKQILEYEKTLMQVKEQSKSSSLWSVQEVRQLETKLENLKQRVYSQLTAWDRVAICRHPSRPRATDYIRNLCDPFVELAGDRLFRDDRAILCGLAKIDGVKCMVIAQEKGCDTESRLHRNFGMPHPEGYRKAMRCMRLAAKFRLPILCLVDTPGAYPGLSAEERGQGWAIAQNLWEMARLRTQIVVVLIGEGCSGGALGIGVGDQIAMLQHAYYSVISPEGCASILWKDAKQSAIAAAALKMQSEDLKQLGVIDAILDEPLGGAHQDPSVVYQNVKAFVLEKWNLLKEIPTDILIEQRYHKFRNLGRLTGHEAPS